jgi:hypothetical protein
MTVVSKSKSNLVRVQEVRWQRSGTEPAGEYAFFYRNENENKRIILSAIKRVEFVCDKMSYIILKNRWCFVIVLNVHAPTEDKM